MQQLSEDEQDCIQVYFYGKMQKEDDNG
jgi:hypothetical protein